MQTDCEHRRVAGEQADAECRHDECGGRHGQDETDSGQHRLSRACVPLRTLGTDSVSRPHCIAQAESGRNPSRNSMFRLRIVHGAARAQATAGVRLLRYLATRVGYRYGREVVSKGNPETLDMVAVRTTGRIGAPEADHAKRDSDPWAMIDVFPLPAFICGPDGALLRYNKRAEELWGVAPGAGSGHRFGGAHRLYRADGSLIPMNDRPVAKVLNTGTGMRDLELIVERQDGSRIRVLANIEPLFDEN